MASFLTCFDPELDDLKNKRFAMWAALTDAYGIKLLLYGDPIPRTPINTTIYPSIEHAQAHINGKKCLFKKPCPFHDKPVEWVFMISPLARCLPFPQALRHFKHPADAVYVFGPDYKKHWEIEHFQIDHRVQVSTFQDTGELHALTVATIVAYHRYSFRLPSGI